MITDLNILDKTALCNDNTSTLVATNKWKLSGQWPVTVDCVQVGMANTCLVFSFKNEYVITGNLPEYLMLIKTSFGPGF